MTRAMASCAWPSSKCPSPKSGCLATHCSYSASTSAFLPSAARWVALVQVSNQSGDGVSDRPACGVVDPAPLDAARGGAARTRSETTVITTTNRFTSWFPLATSANQAARDRAAHGLALHKIVVDGVWRDLGTGKSFGDHYLTRVGGPTDRDARGRRRARCYSPYQTLSLALLRVAALWTPTAPAAAPRRRSAGPQQDRSRGLKNEVCRTGAVRLTCSRRSRLERGEKGVSFQGVDLNGEVRKDRSREADVLTAKPA